MKNDNFWNNFKKENLEDVKMVITVGNQLLSNSLGQKIKKIYDQNKTPRPLTIHLARTPRLFIYKWHEYLDYCVSTINHGALNFENYQFPGVFIGKQVVYDAFKYLCSQSDKLKDRIGNNTLILHNQINYLE